MLFQNERFPEPKIPPSQKGGANGGIKSKSYSSKKNAPSGFGKIVDQDRELNLQDNRAEYFNDHREHNSDHNKI